MEHTEPLTRTGMAQSIFLAGWRVVAGLCMALSHAHASDALLSASHPEKFEGALGLVTSYSPSYPGASDHRWGWRPAGFVRYGRWTISGAGGFTTVRQDEPERGLEAELLRDARVRVGLGLRLDTGRSEGRSPGLAGMGDVRRTLRSRLTLRFQPDDLFIVSAALSADLLGRGGGLLADLGASHQWPLGHGRLLIAGMGVSLADQRYMQSWHGVSDEQAARSGHPPYHPAAGLRSVSLGLTYRHEFGPSWSSFVGLSHSRLLGPAADSPLTLKPSATSLTGGVAWRF